MESQQETTSLPSVEIVPERISRSELRMLARAAREGWMKGTRWPTDATDKDFAEAQSQRPLTLKEQAAIAARDAMNSGDARLTASAVRCVVAMEAQNQADDLRQSKRKKDRRPNAADIGAGIGIGLGLGMPGGGTIDDKRREAAKRIAGLFGVGDGTSGDRLPVAADS